jgi:hypothetical protein
MQTLLEEPLSVLKLCLIKKVSSGFSSLSGAVSENPLCFGSVTFSGCSEKSFSAFWKIVFLSERFEPTTFGTNYSVQEQCALVDEAIRSLNISCGWKFPYKGNI